MLNVVPYGFYYGGEVVADTPTRSELGRAYASALGALGGSGHEERAFWTRYAWTFLLGGVMPLVGHSLFGWPVGLVVFAIALDVAAIWLADLVRALLASESFQYLARRQLATENALMVAGAMLRHRRHPGRGIRARRLVEAHHPWLNFLVLYVGCYGGMVWMYVALLLFFVVLDPDAGVDKATLWWLALPAVLRVVTALRDATTEKDGRVEVHLQPQAMLPMGALFIASLLGAWVMAELNAEQWFRDDISPYYGILFLVLYVVCAVGLGLMGLSRLRNAEADLRRFTHIELEEWQERLQKSGGGASTAHG